MSKHCLYPLKPAASALKALVEQTKCQLIYSPDFVRGGGTDGVSGNLSAADALAKMLQGTGITVVATGDSSLTLQRQSEVASHDMVVVSARKKEERMIDVPIAMTALSGERLKRRGASSIAEVLQDSPGVSAFDSGHLLASQQQLYAVAYQPGLQHLLDHRVGRAAAMAKCCAQARERSP